MKFPIGRTTFLGHSLRLKTKNKSFGLSRGLRAGCAIRRLGIARAVSKTEEVVLHNGGAEIRQLCILK